MSSESQLTRRACRLLAEEHGAEILPIIAGKMGASGWPDRYIAHQLWRGFVEFKADSNPLSPLQRARIKRLQRVNQPVAVVRWASGMNADLRGSIEDTEGVELAPFRGVLDMLQHLAAIA